MSSILRFLMWLGVAGLGAAAVGVAAFQQGEPVNALWLVVAARCTQLVQALLSKLTLM